jgi:ABC-type polysaccharide/polyol phosphate transport system ATPase subunit
VTAAADDMNFAVRVRGLSKVFKIYDKPSDMLWEVISRRKRHREFLALDGIDFDVPQGGVVGIIGPNGAGKTTLLRVIAGTLDKTRGDVTVNGRVSAIMALGTGFNPDLSGRDNILVGGLCLGMNHAEVMAKADAIIAFSGLKDFIDQPLRTYSSGMWARLAFSVAASIDPDILIVDEALATGDAAFAAKSYARIKQLARSGATVLFVTHALDIIYDLCDTAMLLRQGRLVAIGEPREVGRLYEKDVIEAATAIDGGKVTFVMPGTDAAVDGESTGARIVGMEVVDGDGKVVTTMWQDLCYRFRIRVVFDQTYRSATIGFRITKPSGTVIYGFSTARRGFDIPVTAGEMVTAEFEIPCLLAQGTYYVCAGVGEMPDGVAFKDHCRMLYFIADGLTVEVRGDNVFAGVVDFKGRIADIQVSPVKDSQCSA